MRKSVSIMNTLPGAVQEEDQDHSRAAQQMTGVIPNVSTVEFAPPLLESSQELGTLSYPLRSQSFSSSLGSTRKTPTRVEDKDRVRISRQRSSLVSITDTGRHRSLVSAKTSRLTDVQRMPSKHSLTFTIKRKAVMKCRALNKNKIFQAVMFLALLSALFLPDVWILANRPGNSDLDIVLTIVLLMFLTELTVQSVGLFRTYFRSFFFYMDLMGAISLLLDISYLDLLKFAGTGNSASNNAMVMRAARIAKLGARAGRFTRLVKLLRFLPGMQEQQTSGSAGAAKRLSARLVTSLSTRVSCLIIVMVVVMPLFSMWTFPEEDWSRKGWLVLLERVLRDHPERLARHLERFEEFYADMTYWPIGVVARAEANMSTAALPWKSSRGAPIRKTNLVRIESGMLLCDFNFEGPNQMDSAMSLCLLVTIMVLMVGFSMMLSSRVSVIVLVPLEKLLIKIRQTAALIFKSVTDMASNVKNEEDDSSGESDEDGEPEPTDMFRNETGLLGKVVRKLANMNQRAEGRANVVGDNDELQDLTELERTLINGFFSSYPARGDLQFDEQAPDGEYADQLEQALADYRTMLDDSGMTLDLLNSWNLNPLELDSERIHAAAVYFLGPHNHGFVVDKELLSRFLEDMEQGYNKGNPYHNWFHAIDVTHCVYRLLQLCSGQAYLTGVDRYAAAVSAVAHDVGHMGLNNAFLVETAHEVALRYNDRSPLENMHCSKLFATLAEPGRNVFASLSEAQVYDARQVCIEAILHTDNALHFAMIKEIQINFEVDSEILDVMRAKLQEDNSDFPGKDAVEVFRKPEWRRLITNLVLHTSDVSNSVKPFRICRIWASQVLDEFFLQGDTERKLGVPVQALNDREKVNRAFSQVGFIEFLVAPLLFAVVRVLPPLESLLETMTQNMMNWHQVWLQETRPPPTQEERALLEDRIRKLQNRYIDLTS